MYHNRPPILVPAKQSRLQSGATLHLFHHRLPFPAVRKNHSVSVGTIEEVDLWMLCEFVCKRRGRIDNLIWSLLYSETTTIKQKCDSVEINWLSVTISMHELLQLCVSLNPEKHFSSILKREPQYETWMCLKTWEIFSWSWTIKIYDTFSWGETKYFCYIAQNCPHLLEALVGLSQYQ